MSEQKPSVNTNIPIKDASKYHWWYDAKSAGVRNSPPTGMSPRSPSTTGFTFMSTSPASTSGINPSVKRRDSLKNMVHLCDFATP